MPRRPVTSMDPWQAEQDELDRLYEQAPANERPIYPPSPAPCQTTGKPAKPVEHHARAVDDPLLRDGARTGAYTSSAQE